MMMQGYVYGLLLCILLLSGCSESSEKGIITFKQADFRLEADSKVYWQPIKLPDNWNISRPGVGGVGIYRFEIDMEEPPKALWALFLPRVSNNAEVFLNGDLITVHGDTKQDSLVWNTPLLVTIPSMLFKTGVNTLEIKVFAQVNYLGRLLPPMIGQEVKLKPYYNKVYFNQIALSQICAVFSLTMGAGMFLVWWYRREPMYGWFAIGGISWACYASYFFVVDLPFLVEHWIRFCFSMGFVMFSAMLIFIIQFMSWKYARKIWFILGYGLGGSLLLQCLPDSQLFNGIRWVTTGYAVMYAWLALALLNALRVQESKRHAFVSLTGIGMNAVLGIHDWANIFFSLNHSYFLQYGQPLIFIVMAQYMLKDYMMMFEASKMTNAELDQRVHLREKELLLSQEKSQKIEQNMLLLKERERIMADIHDGVGGHLISALSIAESSAGPEGALISQTIHQTLDELRIIVDSLDPDERKLSQMLASFRYRHQQRLERQGIAIVWELDRLDELDQLGPEKSLQLLRMLQELITNVIKHAKANQITVYVTILEGEKGKHCWASVADNGIGFDVGTGFGRGLGNLKRRAETIGGSICFVPQAKGTLAEVKFPIA